MGRGVGAGLRIVVALASTLSVAGCAAAGSPGGDPGPTSPGPTSTGPTTSAGPVLPRPLTPVTARELREYCPAVDAQHFDGETAAVLDIYLCSASDILSTNGAGSDALPDVQRASRVIAGGDELLAAYSVPNAAATADACIQLAADPLIVWVNTIGGVTPVYAPVDECGFPTRAATEAFNGVELETILETRAGGQPVPGEPSN